MADANLVKDDSFLKHLEKLEVEQVVENPSCQNLDQDLSEYKDKNIDEIIDPNTTITTLLKGNSQEFIDLKSIVLPKKPNLGQLIEDRLQNFINTDCLVQIHDEEFSCHIIVLKSFSPFFRDHLDGRTVIQIPCEKCSPSIFAFIYEWMITEYYFKEFTEDVVLDVFEAAIYFGIKQLINQCWAFIANPHLFSEVTAFRFYVEADKRKLLEVCELMLSKIDKIFLLVVSSKDWLDLTLSQVTGLLKSNYILINSEIEIFMSAVRWLFHDWENRAQHKVSVMNCIRFANMGALELIDLTRNPRNPQFIELLRGPELSSMVDEGLTCAVFTETCGEGTDEWRTNLGLVIPDSRNWSGDKVHYQTYNDFLKFLKTCRVGHVMKDLNLKI